MSDTAAEFQSRRTRTWRAVRWWLPIGILGGLTFAWVPGGQDGVLSQRQFAVMMAGFFTAAIAIVFLIRGILAHYRCPSCNGIPMTSSFSAGGGGFSYRRSVDLNPTECSHCGARLKVGH